MDTLDVDKYILGETEEEFLCVSDEDNQKIAVAMIQQAELELDILSRDFDPAVYDNHECCEAIEDLALRSRHSRIRILLHETRKASQHSHLVIHLGRRLGSLMQFRNVAETHKHIPDTFMIVDGIGIMLRPHTDTLAATVNFKDRPKVKKLSKLFEKLWEDAEPDPNTRYMIL
ncbi:MAG TPA: hypothetical protein ENI48_00835 [Thioploca sp.]|nr:hypothetical protein [Thioploca sp.]